MRVTSLPTTPYSLLAMTFPSRLWLDTVHGDQESHVTEGGMFSCTVWVAARQSLPVCEFYAKPTDDRHNQTQSLYLRQKSKQHFLWVLVGLNFFLHISLYKKRCTQSTSQHTCHSRYCLFPRLSVLEGSSHGCVQLKACSRLSPDQPCRDNQVRWSNGPPGP